MNKSLVVSFAVAMFFFLTAQHVNSPVAVLAKGVKSSEEKQTLADCYKAVSPIAKPVDMLFISACLILAPHVFKAVGDTMLGLQDSQEGVDPFKHKKTN